MAENSLNETCADGFVDFVCREPAGSSKSGWCFHCQCGSEQLMDAQKCSVEALSKLVKSQTVGVAKKPAASPKPKTPSSPKRPGSPPDDTVGGPGTIVPESPGTAESANKPAPASVGKVSVIGGGVGGGLAGILLIASVAAFFVSRKRRRRYGKGAAAAGIGSQTHLPPSSGWKSGDSAAGLFVVDEFNADEVRRKNRSPRNSVRDSFIGNPTAAKISSAEKPTEDDVGEILGQSESVSRSIPSSMPALALLARADSITRIKAGSPNHSALGVPPTNPFSDSNGADIRPTFTAPLPLLAPQADSHRAVSPFADEAAIPDVGTAPPSTSESTGALVTSPDTDNPLYLEHLRERQEMRQHWQQRSAAPEPALATSSAPLSIASSPALFPALPNPRRLPTGLSTPIVPSPLRTASTLSVATTGTSSSGGTAGRDRRSLVSSISSTNSSVNSHLVLSAHVAQHSDELTLNVGDIVVVWRVWEDGWCLGSVIGGSGDGQGVFP
ncbi:hypothetical protein HDU87_004976, partial [Geranomyces variabilis]